MKQIVSLAVLLLTCLAIAAGCAGGGGPDVGREGSAGRGEQEEPGAFAVAASCAAGGAPRSTWSSRARWKG